MLSASFNGKPSLQALGRFPDPPGVRSDLLLAVAHGDLETQTARLRHVVDGLALHAPTRSTTRPPHLVTFYLEGPGSPEWSPFGEAANGNVVLHPAGAVYLEIHDPPEGREA